MKTRLIYIAPSINVHDLIPCKMLEGTNGSTPGSDLTGTGGTPGSSHVRGTNFVDDEDEAQGQPFGTSWNE